ncbi:hypothetical protein GALL_16960 [mine drainage metagenome]|uniref:Uncharacterized protein n=1 Tax=mine drainage metagenome TaxID=410659 RepID=A0A1J5TQ33_9ZZZZ
MKPTNDILKADLPLCREYVGNLRGIKTGCQRYILDGFLNALFKYIHIAPALEHVLKQIRIDTFNNMEHLFLGKTRCTCNRPERSRNNLAEYQENELNAVDDLCGNQLYGSNQYALRR